MDILTIHSQYQDALSEVLRAKTKCVVFEPTVILKRENVDLGYGSRIDAFCKIEGGLGVKIGRGVHVASFSHLNVGGGELEIEDFAGTSSGVKLVSGTNETDAASCSASAPAWMTRVIKKKTLLKKFSIAFAGSVVLPGVTLGEGAVLGAHSLATQDIPDWQIWAGSPARFIAYRIPKCTEQK